MKKIIIVDDYKDFADMVREYVELRVNAECLALYDSEQTLEYINNEKDVDILVTDYQMPKMNGFELAKKVLEKCSNIKIIIWSGHDKSTLNKVNEEYKINAQFLSKSRVADVVKLILES